MASLRHCNFIKRILVVFVCVNCLIILLSSWTREGGGREYFTGNFYTDEVKTKTDLNISPNSTRVITMTTAKEIYTNTTESFVAQRMHERVNFTRERCRLQWSEKLRPSLKSYVFFDNQAKLAQCIVTKAGSTYWGRIFSFLTRPEIMKSLDIHAPAHIDRIWLHHVSGVRGKIISGNNTDSIFQNNRPIRFFFARDPFKRLWSVYLDKYFLPGFWMKDPIGNQTHLCGKNTSFQNFLENAVKSDDFHVLPVSLGCNPCVFKPDVIGDMNTFTQDTEYILRRANYSQLLDDYDERSYAEREITSISAYNFMVWRSIKNFKPCLKLKELSRMLWKVFQYNGHIRDSFKFPEERIDYSPLSSTLMFLDAIKTKPVMTRLESSKQRHRFLVEAYRNIPKSNIQSIQERYRADFDLFRYDVNPPA